MMTKCLRFILGSTLLVICNPFVSRALSHEPILHVEDGRAGSTVEVTIGLSECNGVKGFDFIIDFSKGGLLSTGILGFARNEEFYPHVKFAGHDLNSVVEVSPGKLRLIGLLPATKKGPVEIGTLSCHVSEDATVGQSQTLTLIGEINTDSDGVRRVPLVSAKFTVLGIDSISFAEIKSASFSSDRINGSDNESNQILTGTIVLYRTNEGRYGKLLIKTYGYNLTLRWKTFNPDGSTYSEGDDLVIRGTWLCDLDLGKESRASSDFWWRQVTAVERYLVPKNGAKFAIY